MAITAGNFPQIALAAGITLILAGCGLTQKVTDGTVAVTKSIFYKQIKMYMLPFLEVIVLIICTVIFQIGMGVVAFISFFILTITVWIETIEFEVENI